MKNVLSKIQKTMLNRPKDHYGNHKEVLRDKAKNKKIENDLKKKRI